MFKISFYLAVRQVYSHCCCHQLACMCDKLFKVRCWRMFWFVPAYQADSGQNTCQCTWNYKEITRKREVWKVHQGLHRWCTCNDRNFVYLIGHFSKAAHNDHWKHHSSHLETLAANMKSILDDFIRALPVVTRLFSDPCNETVGKHE